MTTNNQTPISVSTEQRLAALEQQLATLRAQAPVVEAGLRERGHGLSVTSGLVNRRFNAKLLAAGVAGAALFAAAGAVSQGTCPAGIPFCFQAGAVIRAAEVNSNFAAVATSLTGKLGVTTQGDVDVQGTLGIKIKTKTCTASVAGEVPCTCDAGELAIGGGATAPAGAFLAASRPKASERDTWEVNCRKADGTAATCTDLRAVCAKMKAL